MPPAGARRPCGCSLTPNGARRSGSPPIRCSILEIAEPGPMRLFLCDMALERARLAFARSEAFAPLNGLIDDGPSKLERPSEAERKSLHDEAAKQLAIAADYIEKCEYHKRDEELAELQAVLHGNRPFADLPPRV
jgi:hypothetical protein